MNAPSGTATRLHKQPDDAHRRVNWRFLERRKADLLDALEIRTVGEDDQRALRSPAARPSGAPASRTCAASSWPHEALDLLDLPGIFRRIDRTCPSVVPLFGRLVARQASARHTDNAKTI
jgi:hypothetical protein